ncbi:MAG: GFA family protein, partial [Sphingomonas sp.]|nr:GFA family protein [Sphingomonas sp.]
SPVRVAVTGKGVGYVQGDRTLTLFHCPTCGVITHWSAVDPDYDRMGINLRLFDPGLWEALPRRFIDGASW